jgi:recombination protein RecT
MSGGRDVATATADHRGALFYNEDADIGARWTARCACSWVHRTQAKVQAQTEMQHHLRQNGADMTAIEPAAPAGQLTVRQKVESQASQLARALPRDLDPDRFVRLVLTELRTVAHLDECSWPSLAGAIMRSAELGLQPGSTLGQCWYLPFKNKDGQYEASFVLGYKGIIKLALQSDEVESVVAREVLDADEFDYEYGLRERLVHRPGGGDRGKPHHWYAIGRFVGGGTVFVVLDRAGVEKHREQSKSPNSPAWRNHYSAMAMKSAVKDLSKFLPLTAEAAETIRQDDSVVDTVAGPARVIRNGDTAPARPSYVDEDGVVSVPADPEPEGAETF